MKNYILAIVKRCTDKSIGYDIKEHTFLSFLGSLIPHFTLIYDRFGFVEERDYFFNKPNSIELLTSITSQPKQSFSEMCIRRCDELIKLAGNKKIFISYSGGVDSTCILSSFLMNEKLYKKNFYVYTNDICNIPSHILDILIKEKIQLIIHDNFKIFDEFVGNNIIIDGCCGDYFHAHINTCVDGHQIDLYKTNSWNDLIYAYCTKNKYTNYDYYINCIENYISKLGVYVTSPAELWWMLAFVFIYRRNSEFRKLLSTNPKDRISFFDTLYFQNYMLTNYIDNGISVGGILYKQKMKKFIYDYTKDESFFIDTSKTLSNWFTGYENTNTIFYKTSTGYYKKNIIDKNDFLNFIRPFIRKEYQYSIY